MDEITPSDPDAQYPIIARRELHALLQQHLVDPQGQHVHIILGWRGSGKSALLQSLLQRLDETFVTVYLSWGAEMVTEDSACLAALAAATSAVVAGRGMGTTPPPTTPAPDAPWFYDVYLPDILKRIRPYRQLVWLWDDANALSQARQQGAISGQLLQEMRHWLGQNPRLSLIIALDTRYEEAIAHLSPLTDGAVLHRLTPLTPQESAQSLATIRAVSPNIAEEVYKLSGGLPFLLAHFHQRLAHEDKPISPEALSAIAQGVYEETSTEFYERWRLLNRDERYVLTAISHLIYEDPLRVLQVADIEAWLAQTDFPMDDVGVKSAIRSLEYREILTHRDKGIGLSAKLWGWWLLDNARLDEQTRGLGAPSEEAFPSARILLLIAVIVLAILLAIIIAARPEASPPLPTATFPN